MATLEIKFLPIAYEDIVKIFDCILLDDTIDAQKALDKITRNLESLRDSPNSGLRLQEDKLLFLHKCYDTAKTSYFIFYKLIDDNIIIYRILSDRFNLPYSDSGK